MTTLVDIFTYHPDRGLEIFTELERLPEIVSGSITWIDIEGKDAEALRTIARHFNLHELTIEDCLTPSHSPKLEQYGSYLFMLFRCLSPPDLVEELPSEEEPEKDEDSPDVMDKEEYEDEERITRGLAIYLSKEFVISHRSREVPWLDAVLRQMKQFPDQLFSAGTVGVAHRIIDVLTDRFLRGLDYIERLVDEQESRVLEEPDNFDIAQLIELKRTITMLKQVMRDQRAVIGQLASDKDLIPSTLLRRYFRDIEDHSKAIDKTLDRMADELTGIRDAYFAMANVRLGDIMRILAIITTIAVPLNLVVGMYGMNFDAIPLLHNPQGFWFILGLLTALVVLLLLFFRRKRWL